MSRFCGTGWALTANIGSHLDGRVTVAWPLIGHLENPPAFTSISALEPNFKCHDPQHVTYL